MILPPKDQPCGFEPFRLPKEVFMHRKLDSWLKELPEPEESRHRHRRQLLQRE
jgi:hypothetical protein